METSPLTKMEELLVMSAAVHGLGTNIGLKRVAAGDHGESYRDLLYARNRFLTKETMRAAITEVANAIFRVRLP